ncbi:hypothetical protein KFL_004030100 [Klebsormidium nitens]|uniref:Uncharacterized protein n=1 Tax=Klebsormidium nitens TaxID=105231 RepID=A0A1Y1IB46_KLENI|nr:hypothetical protein KFL_004030100 [Klebsormidium nitens]|eukprot:GAQ88140.1 hypothetical protein KFL_004030100 [Klebsormidium nitens]
MQGSRLGAGLRGTPRRSTRVRQVLPQTPKVLLESPALRQRPSQSPILEAMSSQLMTSIAKGAFKQRLALFLGTMLTWTLLMRPVTEEASGPPRPAENPARATSAAPGPSDNNSPAASAGQPASDQGPAVNKGTAAYTTGREQPQDPASPLRGSATQAPAAEDPVNGTHQAPAAGTGLRSKRKPRVVFSEPASEPLRPIDANSAQRIGQKRKKAASAGVYFENLEDYVEYMTTSGGEKRARGGRNSSMRTFVKRHNERVARLRASVPEDIATKAMIQAIEARPCKELYKQVGSEEFELLVAGSAHGPKFVSLDEVDLQVLVEFAKASKIDHVGLSTWRLRWTIYRALDLEVLRDHNLLPENGDHLR